MMAAESETEKEAGLRNRTAITLVALLIVFMLEVRKRKKFKTILERSRFCNLKVSFIHELRYGSIE